MHTGPSKYARFGQDEREGPGPAHYTTTSTDLYQTLQQSSSRLGEGGLNKVHGVQERLLYFKPKSFTPGPGQYQSFSAFG